ncbi:MAG: hypothetical protein AAF304_05250 [Pseudomonadota bacterium]
MNLKKLMLAVVLTVMTLATVPAYAVSASFQDPATASWGSWNRGDTGTVYVHWEEFDDCTPGIPFCLANPDTVPDEGNFGASTSVVDPLDPTAFVTGSGAGGNIYTFSGVQDFDVTVTPISPISGPEIRIALQIAILGTDIDESTIMLNGIGFDSRTTLETQPPNPQFGGVDNEYLYLWTLTDGVDYTGSVNNFLFDLTASGSSLSLDALAVDIAAVPVPAAVWLFGSALLGFLGIGRRRAIF